MANSSTPATDEHTKISGLSKIPFDPEIVEHNSEAL
jgi:hypothetical protein